MESDWQHAFTTIQDANLYLLKTKKFADVTFLVGKDKELIAAHKLILMARSPVFEAMFERWETGKTCVVEVPEISEKSFELFLQFLYGNEFVVTGDEAAEVLYLAHKYDTKELSSKCSDLLKSAIDIKNVIHIHQVAAKLEQKALQTEAIEFILKNGKQVLEDIGFLQIDLDTLRSILGNDKFMSHELTIFRAVMRWAENKCDVLSIPLTIGNRRIVLKDVIYLIRFPTMSTQEFTDEVIGKYKGILTDSETIGIYMNFTTGSPVRVPELPFSKTKRWSATIYTVNPYTDSGCVQRTCRQNTGQGSTLLCQKTFQFYANCNIRLTAIELYEHPEIQLFSISVYPPNQPIAPTLTKLRPNSSTVFDLNNGGIDVLKDVPYAVQLNYNGGQSSFRGNMDVRELAGSMQVDCWPDSITFSFSASSGNCHYRYYCEHCICSGNIKAMHFTF